MSPVTLFLKDVPRPVWIALGTAILVAALAWAVMAWGQARYDAGVSDTDAKWVEAGRRLEAQARSAGRAADTREADRIKDHAAEVAEEKEKIDAAIAAGDSPLDVLFGGV